MNPPVHSKLGATTSVAIFLKSLCYFLWIVLFTMASYAARDPILFEKLFNRSWSSPRERFSFYHGFETKSTQNIKVV